MLLSDKLAAATVIFFWGINFYFMKLGVEEIDPMLLGCLRFIFVIFPLIFFIPKPKVAWRWLLLYGFISNFAQFAFMFSAIATGLATSLIALVVQSQAFFTVLIAVFFLGEKARANQWLAIFIAIFGFILIAIGYVVDLTRVTNRIAAVTYEPLPPILAACVLYMVLIGCMLKLQRWSERYVHRLAG
ncbi:EamA family transporter [Gallibacterium anatis]|uniref:EamA family transporter n=1 Tax=Gallibacterium anatis TaxID=750 RepID=UPI0009B85F55|nr:EamA family transporter [Gallibacterium anatis]